MAKFQSRWEQPLLVRILSGLGVLSWFGFTVLWLQYDNTRPASRQPIEGRVYQLNTHGHFVFLTHTELTNLYILGLVGAVFLLTAMAAKLSASKRN
jgi:hypothetical protein